MQIRLVKGQLKYLQPKTIFQILLALIWTRNTIWPFIEQLFGRLPLVSYVYQYIFPSLLLVTAVLSVPFIIQKLRAHDFLFCFSFVVLVLVSYLLFSKNQVYIETYLYDMLVLSLPMYLLGVCCSYVECNKTLFWMSLISVATMFAYQAYLIFIGDYVGAYNMSASYKILPSVMYLISCAMNEAKVLNLCSAAAGIFLLFSYGTRGPILAVFVFLFAGAFISLIKSKKVYYRVFAALSTGMLVLIASSEQVIINLAIKVNEWFSTLGLSTRIFDYFINGEIAYDSGRNILKATVESAISQRPMFGYGIMGDRVLLGTYVHNLPLELWCDFGMFFGTLFLGGIAFLSVWALRKSRGTPQFVFVGMFICFVLIKLFFSGSYLIEPYFYFMIGVLVNAIRNPYKIEMAEQLN